MSLNPRQGLLDFTTPVDEETGRQRPFYFAHESEFDKRWLVCHHVPGGFLSVDCDCPSQRAAEQEAGRLNDEKLKRDDEIHRAWLSQQVPFHERKLIPGLYTDKDAA